MYQKNLYNPDKPFYSAKKVLHDMGPDFECVQLVSFNSISKVSVYKFMLDRLLQL